jgi:hypothetical protein
MALAQELHLIWLKPGKKLLLFYPRTKVRGNGSQKKNIPF